MNFLFVFLRCAMKTHYSRVRLDIWYIGKIQSFGQMCSKKTTPTDDSLLIR